MSIKSYKGFNKDMRCRDFQYEVGKEYTTDRAEVCKAGFHACEYPLDCFNYYSPNEAVFHEVKQDGDLSRVLGDTKVASTKIKIGVQLSIADMVKAAIDFTMSKIKPEAKADENRGASSATGDCGVAVSTGELSTASTKNATGCAVAWGYNAKAKGIKGSRIVLADWEYNDDNDEWVLKGAKMVKIDGKKYKADTWYTMKNGQIMEVK